MMKNLSFLILCFMVVNTTFAQSNQIIFNNESSVKEIPFTVSSEKEIAFSINSNIKSGGLEVSIIDPNGKREGNFLLEAMIDNGKSYNNINIKSKSKNKNSNKNSNQNSSTINISSGTGINSNSSTSTISVQGSENGDSVIAISSSKNISSGQTITSSDDSGANGTMVKSMENPIPGKWILKIASKDVTGVLNYSIDKD